MCSRENQRGQVLPLVALSLVALMGFAAMAVDLGYLKYEQRQQQSAADAGALAGAVYELKNGGCTGAGSGVTAAVLNDTSQNGYANGSGGVLINTAPFRPTSGPFVTDPCAVQVQVYSPHLTFFSKLFGMTGEITTQAVATIAANNNGCAYYLDPNHQTTFSGPNIQAPGCSIYTNNQPFSIKGGQQVTVAGLGYSQTLQDSGGTKYTLASPVKIPPVTDPCMEIPGCAALTTNPPPSSPCPSHAPNTAGVLNPGCYTTDFIVNGNVTMQPGTYVINGQSPTMHGNLTGTGVTIYVTATGAMPATTNGSSITLTPPSTGPYAKVVFYQVPSNSNSQVFNGTPVDLSGLVYAPGMNDVTYNGQQRTYMVLILGSARYNGNQTNITFVAPAPGQSLIQNAVLAQ